MSRFIVCLFIVVLGVAHEIFGSPLAREDRLARTPHLNIINGKNASIKDFPYMASIFYNDMFLGSGAILNKNWILTTAWNVAGYPTRGLTLRVGSNFSSEGGQALEVKKTVVAEGYKVFDWDVAVVKTTKPIRFNKNVKSIKLANETLEVGTEGKISGWGAVDKSYIPSPTLQQTTVTVSNWTACAQVYGTLLTERLFCTFDNNTGPLGDDFGDPLVVNGSLYGLYSGSLDDNPGANPMLFTSIPDVRLWIMNAIL